MEQVQKSSMSPKGSLYLALGTLAAGGLGYIAWKLYEEHQEIKNLRKLLQEVTLRMIQGQEEKPPNNY